MSHLFSLLDASNTWTGSFPGRSAAGAACHTPLSPSCPCRPGFHIPGQYQNALSLFMRGWKELCSQLIH